MSYQLSNLILIIILNMESFIVSDKRQVYSGNSLQPWPQFSHVLDLMVRQQSKAALVDMAQSNTFFRRRATRCPELQNVQNYKMARPTRWPELLD